MEEYLYTLLASAVSFPIAWGALGEGTSTPRASMYRVGGMRDMTFDGPALMQGSVQIDAYGSTYAEAITAARAIRDALEGYQGGPIQGAFLEAIRDRYDEDAQLLQRVSMTFSVIYRD